MGCFHSSEGFSQVIPNNQERPRLILLLFGGIPNSPLILTSSDLNFVLWAMLSGRLPAPKITKVTKAFARSHIARASRIAMQNMTARSRNLIALGFFLLLAWPVHAGTPKAALLPDPKQTCKARLPSGQLYEVQRRAYHWKQNGSDVYTDATAYYAPGSGEFLWWGMGYTKEGYLKDVKNGPRFDCTALNRITIELQDGELALFFAEDADIHVFHSRLKFSSIKKGWRYVAEHPDETSEWFGGKWQEWVRINKDLGDDFFRPEKLRFDARAYNYNSLASVKKIGSTWQVEIKGADEPNRALAVLDSNFRLVKVTRTVAPAPPQTP